MQGNTNLAGTILGLAGWAVRVTSVLYLTTPVIHIDHIWRCGRGHGRQEDVEILSAGTDFVPIAMETPMNKAAFHFLSELGRRISQKSDSHRDSAFIFQRLSMTVQRLNAVAV